MTTSISGLSVASNAGGATAVRPDDSDRKARMGKTMQSVADLLGMSTDDLKTARKSGKTLSSLATDKGVSQDDLVSTLATALKQNAPADAPAGADFTKMATDMANSTRGPGGHGGHHSQRLTDVTGSTGTNASTSDLSSVLSSLGVNVDSLASLLNTSQSDGTTTSTADDFTNQLQTLLKQYSGTKGNLYDTAL